LFAGVIDTKVKWQSMDRVSLMDMNRLCSL